MKFRQWVHEIWVKNCDEHIEYQQSPVTQEHYFRMYKYWLKREYRHQMRETNG